MSGEREPVARVERALDQLFSAEDQVVKRAARLEVELAEARLRIRRLRGALTLMTAWAFSVMIALGFACWLILWIGGYL